MDCIFCKIANREISSTMVYEDDTIVIFKDLNPIAPIHLLAIPKSHVESANKIDSENSKIVSHIFETIARIHKDLGLKKGYRIINNCDKFGGQTVPHIHFHILGGKELNWVEL